MRLLVALFLLGTGLLTAAQQSGSVRAADQFIPGATVTARNGGAKVVAYTDETGHYSLDLLPGAWEIQIDMFGFAPFRTQIDVGALPENHDWTLEMPRLGQPAPAPAAAKPEPAKPPPTAAPQPVQTGQNGGRRGPGGGRYGQGRGGNNGNSGNSAAAQGGRGGRNPQTPQQPGFQNMSVTATEEGAQDLASAAAEPPPDLTAGADSNDSFLVTGTTSGGLAAATDEQARRDRMMGGRGPGGPGGGPGMMSAADQLTFNGGPGADPLGMNGFGAAGANNGFGLDNGGGFGPAGGRGGPGGPGGGRGGPGAGGGGGGGGGGGRGGGGGGRGGRGNPNQRRGPYNGQFASFGNRRRTQPAYTGSIAVTLTNSALNAAPFSLNGQSQPKPSTASETVAGNIGGPVRIPKLVTNDK